MKTIKRHSLVLLSVGIMLFAGCSHIIDPPLGINDYTATSNFSFTISAEDKSGLELDSINGAVVIHGDSTTTDVIVSGKKIVKSDSEIDAQNYLKNLKVSIAESGATLLVTSEQPEKTDGRDVSIEYDITVPMHWATKVTLINGSCVFEELTGDVATNVTNGNVSLQELNANAYIRVTNGQIEGRVALLPHGTLNAQTTNGLIALGLPKSTSAQFVAQVTNGTVNVSDLNISDMTGSQKEIRGTIGDGDGQITLKTTNGNISVTGY